MPAAMALLERRLHAILLQVVAKLDQVRERVLVIGVESYPFAPLVGGIDRVEGDGDFSLDVAADRAERQAEPLAGHLVRGPEVVMAAALRVRPVGLDGIGPPVEE